MATRISQLVTENIDSDFATAMDTAGQAAGLPAGTFTVASAQFAFAYFAAQTDFQNSIRAALAYQAEILETVNTLKQKKQYATDSAAPQSEIDAFQSAIDTLEAAHTEAFGG